MATYKSQYTGPQIDQAVGNALNKDTSTLSNDVNHIPASSVVKSAIMHDLANIVATGTTNTTGATITAGTYFYLDGVLVQAIGSGIGTGAPFTLNTNYKVVTAGGLNELKAAFGEIGNYESRLTNISANVSSLLARKVGNIVMISFALAIGTTTGTQLFTILDTPATLDYIAPVYNSSGVPNGSGSVWIEHGNTHNARYYGSTLNASVYVQLTFMIA